jgi:hypothetical protein
MVLLRPRQYTPLFRLVSFAATTTIFNMIVDQNPWAGLGSARPQFFCGRVLGSSTQAAFTDGKTSHQYREVRFRLSLEGHASTDDRAR